MKRCARFFGYISLTILLSASTLAAGENPFSEKEVSITQQGTAQTSGAALPAIKAGESVEGTVEVGSSLNIRAFPWGDIIGSLTAGAKVKIIGQLGDWYKIEYDGKTAYVHSAYVKRPGEGQKPFPTQGWVNASTGVNVRRVPGGDVIGTLKDQRAVEILGQSGDYYKIKWGDNEAFVLKRYIDSDQPSKPGSNEVEPMNFIGYVNASIGLNVRTAPWGAIDNTLPNGIAVQVTGKIGDWYRINFNGKTRYVHADYVVKSRDQISSNDNTSSTDNSSPSTGSLQQKVAAEARKLVGSTRFRGPEVDYGNLACAQVASTALKKAGAIDSVVLNVRSVVSQLKSKGWKEVSVPPFKEGDVITWKTYDYTGDGVKDPDTHVGIMVKEGNSMLAMNNSSRLRTPRLTDPYAIGPITRVLRKV